MWRSVVHGLDWFALEGRGYQFWSGIGSGSPFLAGVWVMYRRHVCHVRKCRRFAWHPHVKHGHPVCRKHWHESGEHHVF